MSWVTRFLALTLIALLLSGCAEPKKINGVTYDSYGLIDRDEKKNPEIQYEVVWGNVVWGALLCETIIAPIYFFGFSLYQPVGPKPTIKGQVAPDDHGGPR